MTMSLELRKALGKLIMKGWHNTDPNEHQNFWMEVEEFVTSLHLKDRKCSDCDTMMTFFQWHAAQGMCDKCAEKYAGEWDDETPI